MLPTIRVLQFRTPVLLLMGTCCFLFAGCNIHVASTNSAASISDPKVVETMATDEVHFSYIRFDEGLGVFVADNFGTGGWRSTSVTQGTGIPHKRTHTMSKGDYEATWTLSTLDGITGELTVNDQTFQLSAGQVFYIDVQEGGVTVTQHDLLPEHLGPNEPACKSFVESTLLPKLSEQITE